MKIRNLKNIIFSYFKIWWIPVVFYMIPFGIFILGHTLQNLYILEISKIVFLANIIGNLISSIVQIVNKKWFYLVPQIIITFSLLVLVSAIYSFSPPNYYGTNKVIPNDIEISTPLKNKPNPSEMEEFDLMIVSTSQPGTFDYYTDYKPKELGSFYIKVFEITSNENLSSDSMKEYSLSKVRDNTRLTYSGGLKIHEGTWGDKYGARIELWFDPINKKSDYKITERNYIIEGWIKKNWLQQWL